MSQVLACDYSTARPDPSAIRQAGYVAVLRYLSANVSPGKDLTKAEADALLSAGLGIGVVWETSAQRALSGTVGGAMDGQDAAIEANAIGLPAGCLLLVNVGDFIVTPDEVDVIHAYYMAFTAEVDKWQYGAYGTAYIIDGLVKLGAHGLWWQNAMNDQNESGSVVSPNAGIYQRVTPTKIITGVSAASYDEDVIIRNVNWWTKQTGEVKMHYTIPGIPGTWQGPVTIRPDANAQCVADGTGTDGNVYTVRTVAGIWQKPVKV